jgi:hypothetical protein
MRLFPLGCTVEAGEMLPEGPRRLFRSYRDGTRKGTPRYGMGSVLVARPLATICAWRVRKALARSGVSASAQWRQETPFS